MRGMSLLALQRDFRNWLVDAPGTLPQQDGLQPGLDVYHNAYRVQLCDCLKESFERVFLWLGEKRFLEAARTHIESHPPHGWTLGIYGEGFDATLARLYPDDPEVAELSWLDWSLCRAFDGADALVALPSALGEMDWDAAVIRFVPTVRLRATTTNAGAIWSALSAGTTPPAVQASTGGLLAWRHELTPCYRAMDEIDRIILEQAMAGARFGTLCWMLVEQLGETQGVARAGTLLGQWLQEGLVCEIGPGEEGLGSEQIFTGPHIAEHSTSQ